jgi:hypothetical protein
MFCSLLYLFVISGPLYVLQLTACLFVIGGPLYVLQLTACLFVIGGPLYVLQLTVSVFQTNIFGLSITP